MSDSILNSTKKLLGIEASYTHFDADIITHINTAFFTLNQLGVGPDDPFSITNSSDEWSSFVDDGDIEMVRTYVYLKVRQYFDPPSNSSHLNALGEQIKELEWRMNVQVDPGEETS